MDADVSGCSARVPFLREFLCAWGGDRLADSGAHAGQVLGRRHPEVSQGVRGKLVRETEGGFHLRSRLLKGLFSISWRRDTRWGSGWEPSGEEGHARRREQQYGGCRQKERGLWEQQKAGWRDWAEWLLGAEAGAAGAGWHTASGTMKEAAGGGGMQEVHLERLLVANGLQAV